MVDITNKIKLSPYHKIFYNEWKLKPESNQYHLVFDQTVAQNLDIERLKTALHQFISDYFIFNCHVVEKNQEVFWSFHDFIEPLVYYHNEVTTHAHILQHISLPFDLNNKALYRFSLFKNQDNSYRLILVFHHIILDGQSFNLLINEISNYYNKDNYKAPLTLEKQAEKLQLATNELYNKLEKNNLKNQKFWQKQLVDIEPINLQFIRRTASKLMSVDACSVKEIHFSFNKKIIQCLQKIQTQYEISPYFFSQMIFAILLNKYTSQEKFALSYPIAIQKIMTLIYGSSVNTSLFLYKINPADSVQNLINHGKLLIDNVKNNTQNYAAYPINHIVSDAQKNILQVFFAQTNLKNTPFNFLKNANPVKILKINHEFNIDLSCSLLFEQEKSKETLNYRVRYDAAEMDDKLLNTFVIKYKHLFLEVLHDLANNISEKQLKEYSILDKTEYQHAVYQWNNVKKSCIEKKTIHQLFEKQVKLTPNNIAIVYDNIQWTYLTLNQKANQLAHYIVTINVINPDDTIAVCLEKDTWFIISILAILKTGAAYVPINPKFPSHQTQSILQNTQAKVLLTNKRYKKKFNALNTSKILAVDDITLQASTKNTTKNLLTQTKRNHLAYVLYTSGTTQQPKGVMIEHQSVVSLVRKVNYITITSSDRILQLADTTFDAATFEIWGALLNGATLYLTIDTLEMVCNVSQFERYLKTHHISILWLTKSLFDQIYWKNHQIFSQLLYLLVGGEALNYELIKKLVNSPHRPKHVINGYGPTENTTFSCTYEVNIAELSDVKSIPIGKPIFNRQAYVLNDNLQPLPIGAIGELYVGGVGLARGYLNNEALNHKSFIENPFNITERLYKTGDLVKRLSNGNIEYIGRNDFQVKIRGYRIELNQIETELVGFQGIKQAYVKLITESDKKEVKYLVAYYVANAPIDNSSIQAYLAKRLPEYMQPSIYIYLKELPLMISGKIDNKALPEPILKSDTEYLTPTNDEEKIICGIFSHVLKTKLPISIQDDFFKLGGNSLNAIHLTSLLQKYFSVTVTDIFQLRTPKKMAQHLLYDPSNALKKTLEYIKKMYDQRKKFLVINDEMEKKRTDYLQSCNQLNIDIAVTKNITSVLLTGSTGYLGCNLLRQLLLLTPYKIFLFIRANTQEEAIARINKKYQFYFDQNLNNFLNNRLFIIKADIEKKQFGLTSKIYQELATQVNSVIHAAALVKHYGEEKQFYSANVQATINLLEFTQLTDLKDFHYISSVSVIHHEAAGNQEEYFYTEDDLSENFQPHNNVYIKTKAIAENEVLRYKQQGINGHIYRIGNLAFTAENFKVQQNIHENAFFYWCQCLLKIQSIPKEINSVQVSQTDLTAKAIIKIFDKKQLNQTIYHVFNPYFVNFIESATYQQSLPMKILSINQFVDVILNYLDKPHCNKLILKFLLRQGWLDGKAIQKKNNVHLLQNRTQHILSQLGFEWLLITPEMFNHYLKFIKDLKGTV